MFSNKNVVFDLDLTTKTLKAIAAVPESETIKSIAVDSLNKRIFFSSDNSVYSIKDDTLVVISGNFSGTLRYHNGLIIFNPKEKLMVRLVGSDEALVSTLTTASIETSPPENELPAVINTQKEPETPGSVQILVNDNIIEFVNNKFSDDLIISIISNSKVNFDLSVDAMIRLSAGKVSSRVIMSMKQAMENQNSESK